MRSRPQSQSVSLFPFLAVLVCAMGALILLLIVTTRRIRREALVKAAIKVEILSSDPDAPSVRVAHREVPKLTKPQRPPKPVVAPILPALPTVEDEPNDTARVIAAYVSKTKKLQHERDAAYARLLAERDAEKKKIDQLKRAITTAQQTLRLARLKLRRLEAKAADSKNALSADSRAAAAFKQQAVDLQGRIAALRSEIVDLKEQQAKASSKFAIVPFDGTRGTTRRPIYIECTKDALRILPEDITIRAADLQHFTEEYNPLLAGTQALVHFWEARGKSNSEPAPYVLLLVRPGGTVAYYVARKMLRSYSGPAGYELIEEDWQLDLPKAHPQAKAVCRLAVDRALAARSRTLEDIAADRGGVSRGGNGGTGRNMRFNRATGRFEVVKPDDDLIGQRKVYRNGFGTLLKDADSSSGTVRPPSSTGTRNGVIEPSVTDIRPGTGSGRRGEGTGGVRPEVGGRKSEVGNRQSEIPPSHHPITPSPRHPLTNGPPITPRQNSSRHPLWPLTAERKTPRPDARNLQGSDGNDPGEQWTRSRGADSKGGSSSQPSGRYVGSSKTPGGGAGPNNLNGFSKTTVGGGDGRGTASGKSYERIRWGLSERDATIGFEKEVRVWCTADRVVIGSRQTLRVGKGENREELFGRVLYALDAEARSWGKPPKGFFWVPSPQFVVSPGGNQHYERINGMMKRLGLQASVQYRLDAPSLPPIRHGGS